MQPNEKKLTIADIIKLIAAALCISLNVFALVVLARVGFTASEITGAQAYRRLAISFPIALVVAFFLLRKIRRP